MELDEIVKNISSEEIDERECGFSDLDLLDKGEQKQAIKLVFEVHARDDRLLEYNESCDACSKVCDIEIKGKEDEFIFYVESFGQLDCKEILVKAVEMFEKKLDEFEKALK